MQTNASEKTSSNKRVSLAALSLMSVFMFLATACSPRSPGSSETESRTGVADEEPAESIVVGEQGAGHRQPAQEVICVEGIDCCTSDSDCAATQFRGCCAGDGEEPPCEWYAIRVDELNELRSECAVEECTHGALSPCEGDELASREVACVGGRCTLVGER